MKKILSGILAFCMLIMLAAMAIPVSADSGTTTSLSSGTTTVSLEIGTAKDLVKFADDYNNNIYKGKTLDVKITDDIDLSGIEWEPIGYDNNHPFEGVFDGQNHVISNMTITKPACDKEYPNNQRYYGLFGYVRDKK